MDPKATISILLAIIILIALGGGLWTRGKLEKGIGWQFIRYATIVIALPLAAILELHDALSEAMVALIAGALGYAFGKPDQSSSSKS